MKNGLLRLALRGVPAHLRESIEGDLNETQGGLREALAIALHFQAEPYREAAVRRGVLLLLVAAAGVLWIVPLAVHSLLAQVTVFTEPFSRAALRLWSAPALVAAIASGLLVGRVSLLPPHAEAARLHIVLVLAPLAALAAPSAVQAWAAAGLVSAAAWLAAQNRHASLARPEPR